MRQAAATYGPCSQPGQDGFVGNYFNGYSTRNAGTQPTSAEGISANIVAPAGYVLCSGDTNPGQNFDTTWVMIYGNGTGSGSGYDQSGWMYRYGYPCPTAWAEVDVNNSPTVFQDYYLNGVGGQCVTNSAAHFWEQEVSVGSGQYNIRSNFGSQTINQTSFNPFQVWNQPFGDQMIGEVTFPTSNPPGTPAHPDTYSGVQIQQVSNDGFVSSCGNQVYANANISPPNPNSWSDPPGTCDGFSMWSN